MEQKLERKIGLNQVFFKMEEIVYLCDGVNNTKENW